MKHTRLSFFVLAALSLFMACEMEPIQEPIPDYVYAGGETTVFDASSYAYTYPCSNLSDENFEKHLAGDVVFESIFVTAPADVHAGLGPLFNNNSCVSCHIRNGRSKAALDGEALSGFLIRMSVSGTNEHGGPKPVPGFGGQLQNKAVYGGTVEGSFTSEEVEQIVHFLDGSQKSMYKYNYTIVDPYTEMPDDLMISPRVAPAVFGLGLLEAIPDAAILAHEDVHDADEDGISGKANFVWNIKESKATLGKFGWKAENPTAVQQTADAYHQDMGITSPFFEKENCVDQTNCEGDDAIIDIDEETLVSSAFYFQTLAVPAMRNYKDPIILSGKEIFENIQCASCHVPSFETGDAIIPALSNQKIFPYTDLLLHDMGEDLSDNRPAFKAEGSEWRTAPLWGVGLLPVVNGHMQLMHDGRASNIEEAILWHGGEAQSSKEAYMKLPKSERDALVAFVKAI